MSAGLIIIGVIALISGSNADGAIRSLMHNETSAVISQTQLIRTSCCGSTKATPSAPTESNARDPKSRCGELKDLTDKLHLRSEREIHKFYHDIVLKASEQEIRQHVQEGLKITAVLPIGEFLIPTSGEKTWSREDHRRLKELRENHQIREVSERQSFQMFSQRFSREAILAWQVCILGERQYGLISRSEQIDGTNRWKVVIRWQPTPSRRSEKEYAQITKVIVDQGVKEIGTHPTRIEPGPEGITLVVDTDPKQFGYLQVETDRGDVKWNFPPSIVPAKPKQTRVLFTLSEHDATSWPARQAYELRVEIRCGGRVRVFAVSQPNGHAGLYNLVRSDSPEDGRPKQPFEFLLNPTTARPESISVTGYIQGRAFGSDFKHPIAVRGAGVIQIPPPGTGPKTGSWGYSLQDDPSGLGQWVFSNYRGRFNYTIETQDY